ncbi:MAG: TIGR00730 family Rossman fold protein [Pseudomonadota bacterium]|nr:TIGR00730 family Rossman fold protein [Pseudomonadota bacterium]
MLSQRRICVYCGSSRGEDSVYAKAAEALGREIACNNNTLVYGGAKIGLMGILADTVLAEGGSVIGVMPNNLADLEIAHDGLSELFLCQDMHARKKKMSELSDGFIAMPGGLGTLEEFFEIWTWAQLGIHNKPIGIFNVDSYFDPMIFFIEKAISAGFIKPGHTSSLIIEDQAENLVKLVNVEKYETVTKVPDKRE